MDIKHAKQISGSKLWAATMQAYCELVRIGASAGETPTVNYDDAAFYFVEPLKKEIVGILAYRPTDWTKDIWVCLGWVREDYRRRGIYRAMYSKLQGLRDEKYHDYTISGGVKLTNDTVMSKVMKALDRKPVMLVYRDEPELTEEGEAPCLTQR